ncbi:hypothetical protein NQZ68_000831 [Dissostichus eleginoides]|nr:hypothetical protein NQZ68_000831 [Dissostichus eleginoides]
MPSHHGDGHSTTCVECEQEESCHWLRVEAPAADKMAMLQRTKVFCTKGQHNTELCLHSKDIECFTHCTDCGTCVPEKQNCFKVKLQHHGNLSRLPGCKHGCHSLWIEDTSFCASIASLLMVSLRLFLRWWSANAGSHTRGEGEERRGEGGPGHGDAGGALYGCRVRIPFLEKAMSTSTMGKETQDIYHGASGPCPERIGQHAVNRLCQPQCLKHKDRTAQDQHPQCLISLMEMLAGRRYPFLFTLPMKQVCSRR